MSDENDRARESSLSEAVVRHWSQRMDRSAFSNCLSRKAEASLSEKLLAVAMLDQLHAGLAESTLLLAELAGIDASCLVLDLGAGLGGPARCLAQGRGCKVVAVDLTPAFVEEGRALTETLGLASQVEHRCAEAVGLRLERPADVVWIQHVDMQIPDKRGLYQTALANLAPGGRIAWHDWLAGPGGPPTYPLLWSADGSLSFLSTEAEWRLELASLGLVVTAFATLADQTLAWFARTLAATRAALAREHDDTPRHARLLRLERELTNALTSIAEQRLVPFFAVARAKT